MLVYRIPEGETLRAHYERIVKDVRDRGEIVVPRGLPTREVRNYCIELDEMICGTLPVGIGRDVSKKVMAAELMQWLSGTSDLEQLRSVAAIFNTYSDDGIRLYGAYGPRAAAGLQRAVEVLSDDPSSRQAVVSIWSNDESQATRDLPCTLSWTFMLRDDELHMTTMMRSNDVWRGMAYDIPIMCRIGTAVAAALDVLPGSYTHIANSMHIYESDFNAVENLRPVEGEDHGESDGLPSFEESMTGRASVKWTSLQRWHAIVGMARLAMDGMAKQSAFRVYSDLLEGTERYPILCRCGFWVPSSNHCDCEVS